MSLDKSSLKKIDNFDELNIEKLIDDCDIVFNLIGILVEEQKTSFDFVHHQIPKMISSVVAKKKNKKFYSFICFKCR